MAPVDYKAIVGKLVRDPFFMTPAQVGKLTLRQLAEVYAKEPGRSGTMPDGAGGRAPLVQSYRDIFYGVWSRRGLTKLGIDAKWAEYEAKRAGRNQHSPGVETPSSPGSD